MVSTRLVLYYADKNNRKHYVPQLPFIMAKHLMDKAYFHPLQILLNNEPKNYNYLVDIIIR
jgi:hypothetical protein